MRYSRIRTLCECGIMLALAIVLARFTKLPFIPLPFGGSVTVGQMVPICFIAIKHGFRWGLGTAFCFSWYQVLEGGVFGWGLTPTMLIASLLLDYILAFSVLAFAGMFRKKGYWGMVLGTALAGALRFLIHFLSGIILWANLEQFVAFGKKWVGRPVLYSIVYNGSYMLPEVVIAVALLALLLRIPQIRKLVSPTKL